MPRLLWQRKLSISRPLGLDLGLSLALDLCHLPGVHVGQVLALLGLRRPLAHLAPGDFRHPLRLFLVPGVGLFLRLGFFSFSPATVTRSARFRIACTWSRSKKLRTFAPPDTMTV